MCHTKKPLMNLPYGHIVSHLHVTFATYSEITPGWREQNDHGSKGENISAVRTGIRTAIGHPRLLLRVLVTVYIYIGMSSSLRKLCPLKTTPCLSYPQSSLPQSFSAAVVSSGFRGNVQLWSAFSCFVRANLDMVRLIQHVGNRREESLRQIKKLSCSFWMCINLLVKAKIYRSSKLISLTSHGAE